MNIQITANSVLATGTFSKAEATTTPDAVDRLNAVATADKTSVAADVEGIHFNEHLAGISTQNVNTETPWTRIREEKSTEFVGGICFGEFFCLLTESSVNTYSGSFLKLFCFVVNIGREKFR